MPIASSNNAAVRIVEESTFGTTPSNPVFKELRFTGESVIPTKETAVSEVIRSDRQRDFLAEVAAAAEGDLNLEPAFGDELHILLEGSLWNRLDSSDSGDGTASGSITVNTTAPPAGATHGGTIARAAGSFLSDGFFEGQTVVLANSATNDGTYRILDMAADGSSFTVHAGVGAAPLTTESGDADETVTAATVQIDVVAAARTFTRASGSFVVDGFAVGQWIDASGFTTSSGANNGVYRIESVTATVITVQEGFGNEANLVDETGGGDERIFGRKVQNGVLPFSYTIEKEFSDVGQFKYLRGMRMGTLSLNVEAGAIVTGTVGFVGRGGSESEQIMVQTRLSGATTLATDSTRQLNATANVGQIFEGESHSSAATALATCIGSIALEVNNNLRQVACVGSKYPAEINAGFVDVTGTLTAMFEDEVLFNKFVSHTESSLVFYFTDLDGNQVFVSLPRIYYGSGAPAASGGNEEITLEMEFTAIRDTISGGVTVQFDLIPATLP